MRRIRRKLKRPRRPWDKVRIEQESKIVKEFGLKRKREIWKAESILRAFRRRARNLAAKRNEMEEKKLLDRLQKLGLFDKKANLTDVLSLTTENLLERRLQTIVYRKGLANTMRHARQLINHGHIAIGERKSVHPGLMVPKELEGQIKYHKILPQIRKSEINGESQEAAN